MTAPVRTSAKHRFARRPLAAALAAATLLAVGFSPEAPAADMEFWAPAGGNVVIKDSTGAIIRMLINGSNGDVLIPQLPFTTGQAES